MGRLSPPSGKYLLLSWVILGDIQTSRWSICNCRKKSPGFLMLWYVINHCRLYLYSIPPPPPTRQGGCIAKFRCKYFSNLCICMFSRRKSNVNSVNLKERQKNYPCCLFLQKFLQCCTRWRKRAYTCFSCFWEKKRRFSLCFYLKRSVFPVLRFISWKCITYFILHKKMFEINL